MLNKFSFMRLWGWLKILRQDVIILFYAWRHPLTPQMIKNLLAALILYVISPIDLLPDYLPLLGIADDAVLIPTAVWYLTNLLPAPIMNECRQKSERWSKRLPYIFGLFAIFSLAWIVLVIMFFKKIFFE